MSAVPKKETLGVCICSYKYGHLAAHCIESILSQTWKPDKIYFVDDGAGDCHFLKEMYPEVTFIFREKNLGIVDNFQDILFNIVQTDRVIMLGADNWLRSDAIDILEQIKADIITYDIVVTGELKSEIRKRHPKEVHYVEGDIYWNRSSGHHGSMVYNVELAKKVGGYIANQNSTKTEEDLMLYNRLIKAGAKRIHVPKSLLYYRRHKENFNKY